jgi:hypothetical protein
MAECLINFLSIGPTSELDHLELTKAAALRRLTLRMPFDRAINEEPEVLLPILTTVKSPVFREFVLELTTLPAEYRGPSVEHWDHWLKVGNFFWLQFVGNFKITIKTSMGRYRWGVERICFEASQD